MSGDKLPRWYVPGETLLAFLDGPRGGEWATEKHWNVQVGLINTMGQTAPDRTLGYVKTDEVATHRLDERITGIGMRWQPS